MNKVREFISKHQQIFLILALPLTMTALLGAFVFLPTMFQKPKYDFIYSTCNSTAGSYCYENSYYVDDQKRIVQKTQDVDYGYPGGSVAPQLFRYSVATHTSQPLSIEAANALTLDHADAAPDGFRLKQDINNSNIFGPYSSTRRYALTKGAAKHTTDIQSNSYPDPEVLGWVVQ